MRVRGECRWEGCANGYHMRRHHERIYTKEMYIHVNVQVHVRVHVQVQVHVDIHK